MKVLPNAKQIRFAQLTKAAGKPRPATLWVKEPTEDPEFNKAIEQNRIVSVRIQNVGTKKDRGVIGFLKGKNIVYLIFPKDLPMAEGASVIGLNFDELEDGPKPRPARKPGRPRKK